MIKIIVNLTSQDGNEYREVTAEELKKLKELERKYGYLDASTNKEYSFVRKILNRKEISICEVIRYC
jgi:hypothetical protein